MPRANKVCNKTGCAETATHAGNYCEQHQLPAWVKHTKRPTIPGWTKIRQHILHRDNHTCQNCGQPATEVDHIKPLSAGGSSKPDNLQALCTTCNKRKNYAERPHPNRKAGGTT